MPISPKSKWLGHAISCPALLHATLMLSALHLTCLGKLEHARLITYHNMKALQAINHQLAIKAASPTEMLVAAITVLSLLEVSGRCISAHTRDVKY